MLVDDARLILAAWREPLLGDDDVRAWSYRVLEAIPALELPQWLLNLSTLGPSRCMSEPSSDFLYVPELDFPYWFSLRLRVCDLADRADVEAFIVWTCRAAMGEDLDRPEVRFSYQLDHFLNDCSRMDWAKDLLAKEVPTLLTQIVPVSDELVHLIVGSRSSRAFTPRRDAG
jgi:hypothetical protein